MGEHRQRWSLALQASPAACTDGRERPEADDVHGSEDGSLKIDKMLFCP
jgi:hypothetical protein